MSEKESTRRTLSSSLRRWEELVVKISLTGHLKTRCGSGELQIDKDEILVELVLKIIESKANLPAGSLNFQNTLVTVNSVEISAIHGPKTRLTSRDSVLVIPVFHGGKSN